MGCCGRPLPNTEGENPQKMSKSATIITFLITFSILAGIFYLIWIN
jgi:hypothetical protein